MDRHQVPDRVRGAGGRPAPIMSRTGSSRPAAESTMNTTWWMWSLPGGLGCASCALINLSRGRDARLYPGASSAGATQ